MPDIDQKLAEFVEKMAASSDQPPLIKEIVPNDEERDSYSIMIESWDKDMIFLTQKDEKDEETSFDVIVSISLRQAKELRAILDNWINLTT